MAEVEVTKSQHMTCDHPNNVLTNGKIVEKIDDKSGPQVVEHLSTAGECPTATSTLNLENQTQVSNDVLKVREKRRRRRADKRKRRELAKNLTTLDYVTSLSTPEMQEKDAISSSLEYADQASASASASASAGECPIAISTLNPENQTQAGNDVLEAKKMKVRERRRRGRANKRKRRELAKNSTTLDYVASPSTLEMQENDAKNSSLEPADQAPSSAHTEELMGEVVEGHSVLGDCLAASSSKDLEVHAQIDNNSETKEIKSKKRSKVREVPRKKKRKLTSDSSLPATEDIHANSAEGFPLEVSSKVHVSTHLNELIGDMVSVHDPSFFIKQNDLNRVGEPAGGDKEEIKTEVLENSVEENGNRYDASGDFNKSKLDFESVTLKMEPISQDGVTISSELSESSDGDDVSLPDITMEVPPTSPLGVHCGKYFGKNDDKCTPQVVEPLSTAEDFFTPPDSAKVVPQLAPPGVHSGKLRRKLLVLDINGILTDIVNFAGEEYTPDMILSRKAVFKRPFCDDFMKFCFEQFDVGIWSSRTMKNVKSVVDFLMGELQTKLLFCWDQSRCTDTGFNTLENREKPMLLKELTKLWEKHDPGLPWEKGVYNESNTLLLDDSPYKALRNPPYTAIFPVAYSYMNLKDNSLGPGGDLRVYLEGLALADDVQKYVEANPFGQRAITSGNASWNFYCKVIRDTSLPVRKSYNNQSSSKEYGLRQRHQ